MHITAFVTIAFANKDVATKSVNCVLVTIVKINTCGAWPACQAIVHYYKMYPEYVSGVQIDGPSGSVITPLPM